MDTKLMNPSKKLNGHMEKNVLQSYFHRGSRVFKLSETRLKYLYPITWNHIDTELSTDVTGQMSQMFDLCNVVFMLNHPIVWKNPDGATFPEADKLISKMRPRSRKQLNTVLKWRFSPLSAKIIYSCLWYEFTLKLLYGFKLLLWENQLGGKSFWIN